MHFVLSGKYTRALTFESSWQQPAQICSHDWETLACVVDVVAVQSASIAPSVAPSEAQQPNLEILERPKSREHAIDMLRSLSATHTSHKVCWPKP